MTAKLFIDGDERELHYVDMDYNRITSFIGWPVSEIFGGLIHLRFTPRGDEDFFLNWMFAQRDLEYPRCLYTFKNGEVVFYEGDVTEDIFFKYRFADCILIRYKETFSNQWGMETEMVLSPAIQYYNHKSKYPFLKRWNESYIPPSEQTPYQAMEHEPEIDLKFIARFKRMDSYKGEFGFDWMRDDYLDNEDGTKGICENQVALKKEYTPTKIHEQDYFVPWLSMFPKQEGVKLKLSIKEIEGTRKASDIIKLSSKNGIKFVPDELKVSEANGKEITILCESPLSNDTKINLLDKNGVTVGKINILKNEEDHVLHIQFVKVLGNEKNNTYNQRTFAQLLPPSYENLKKDLAKKYFNQALIKLEILPFKEIIVDVDSFAEKGFLTLKFKQDGTRGIPNYKKGFDDELYDKYIGEWGDFKGIIVFLSAMQQSGMEAGHAKPYPRNTNYLMITPMSVSDSLTITHEVAHTLGLYHSSKATGNKNTQESIQKTIRKYEAKSEEDKLRTNINYKGNVYSTKKYIEIKKQELQDLKNIYPKILFYEGTTENIMEPTNINVQRSFWKWQWEKMIEEIKLYHGK